MAVSLEAMAIAGEQLRGAAETDGRADAWRRCDRQRYSMRWFLTSVRQAKTPMGLSAGHTVADEQWWCCRSGYRASGLVHRCIPELGALTASIVDRLEYNISGPLMLLKRWPSWRLKCH